MALDQHSTDEEVFAAYDGNAGYEITGSLTQAATFLTACRILLRRLPKRAGIDGQQVDLNTDVIEREMERCRRWIASKRSAGGAKFYDLGDCRD